MLLLDENPSPKLVEVLAAEFPRPTQKGGRWPPLIGCINARRLFDLRLGAQVVHQPLDFLAL